MNDYKRSPLFLFSLKCVYLLLYTCMFVCMYECVWWSLNLNDTFNTSKQNNSIFLCYFIYSIFSVCSIKYYCICQVLVMLFQGHKRLVLEGIIDFFVKQDELFEIEQKNR